MQISVTKTDSMTIRSCESDSNCVTWRDSSPEHCPMGLGRSLDLRWIKKMAGGKREPDDGCCAPPTQFGAPKIILRWRILGETRRG